MRMATEHEFAAAHRLPGHPGACAGLHGHTYRFEVWLEGTPDEQRGMIADFDEVDRRIRSLVLAELDHRDLNSILENPTAECIVRWIWNRLQPELKGLCQIRLWETPRYSVIYDGD